jgi:methionyl-tRNA formyltransferase
MLTRVEPGSWRVVILTAVPEVAEMTATTLRRLGHDPVAAIGANRAKPTPGLTSLIQNSSVPGTEVLIASSKSEVEPLLQSMRPDLVLSWAFPWRVSPEALAIPRFGAINYHPSLLPRHRGANPVAWTIRMGDSHYGVTWHRMDPGFDTGAILGQRSSPVLEEDTIYDVVPRLNVLALRMLRPVLARIADGDPGDPQPNEGATDAPPFGEDYATIDWSMPARYIHTQVRAWAFTPGTHSVVGPVAELGGEPVRVVRSSLDPPDPAQSHGVQRVDCGDGPLWVLETESLV